MKPGNSSPGRSKDRSRFTTPKDSRYERGTTGGQVKAKKPKKEKPKPAVATSGTAERLNAAQDKAKGK